MKPAGESVAKHDDGGGEGNKFAVGKIYEVKLSTGVEFKGIVLAYDVDPNIVIFEEGTKCRPGNLKNTRMINANFINELKYLGKVKDPLAGKKHRIDLNGLLAKEKLAVSRIERIGVGVTAEAQSIFDALSKTFPVQWEKTDILVMKEVRICSPYDSDCVIGGTTAAHNRIKRVLEMERKKLQLSGTGGN